MHLTNPLVVAMAAASLVQAYFAGGKLNGAVDEHKYPDCQGGDGDSGQIPDSGVIPLEASIVSIRLKNAQGYQWNAYADSACSGTALGKLATLTCYAMANGLNGKPFKCIKVAKV